MVIQWELCVIPEWRLALHFWANGESMVKLGPLSRAETVKKGDYLRMVGSGIKLTPALDSFPRGIFAEKAPFCKSLTSKHTHLSKFWSYN